MIHFIFVVRRISYGHIIDAEKICPVTNFMTTLYEYSQVHNSRWGCNSRD